MRRLAKDVLTERANAIDNNIKNGEKNRDKEIMILDELHYADKPQNKALYPNYAKDFLKLGNDYIEKEATHIGKGVYDAYATSERRDIYKDYKRMINYYADLPRDIRMLGGCQECNGTCGEGIKHAYGTDPDKDIYTAYRDLQKEYVNMPRDIRMREAGSGLISEGTRSKTDISLAETAKAIKNQGKPRKKNEWLDYIKQCKSDPDYAGLSYREMLKKAKVNYKPNQPRRAPVKKPRRKKQARSKIPKEGGGKAQLEQDINLVVKRLVKKK